MLEKLDRFHAELEKDAVVGAFTDSDRWGGGTDGKGLKFNARSQLLKNVQLFLGSYETNLKGPVPIMVV